MFDQYLVTGATGFLGRAVAEELVRRRAQVHALVLRDDPYINLLPKEGIHFVRTLCYHSQDASACGKDRKAEVSPHLPATGACKAGGSIL